MKKTLGGDRLGSGSRMQVEMHNYQRSTHDLGYLWRSTMSSGTLVPFLVEVALPGDTYDIHLDADGKTHPTIGPLFGSYKMQLDVFQCPIRLYQGQLHNNKLGIGMNMAAVKLPQIALTAQFINNETTDIDNAQINPSCILAYLGIRGVGMLEEADDEPTRLFNALPLLMYWDIYKNYYANKQEELGAVIHAEPVANVETVDSIEISGTPVPQYPTTTGVFVTSNAIIEIAYTGATPILSQILVLLSGVWYTLEQITTNRTDAAGLITLRYNFSLYGPKSFMSWNYITATTGAVVSPQVHTFDLNLIDDMREALLAQVALTTPVILGSTTGTSLEPYSLVLNQTTDPISAMMQTQEGLALKTYQSDLFNNWLSTEWIDGTGGIAEITAIDTTGGSFQIDTLVLAKKVYNMLNRIAVSGGSYDDWLDAVYTHDRFTRPESPIYQGGLIKELVFQEVVSNSAAQGQAGDLTAPGGSQPLGTLAGKGTMSKKHKGGKVTIKVDEPSYIIGIISLTPRIDYSQGNKWDTQLKTMDDFHKPALDEIGFQELITEQMAWWTTAREDGDPALQWTTKSAGKQPAWINYMTNVNKVLGNFAITTNEMFMTLNRRYEWNEATDILSDIQDLTTYIDPVKFNQIFAQTALDAQNFWIQIAVDITARRKMSAKIMPNL